MKYILKISLKIILLPLLLVALLMGIIWHAFSCDRVTLATVPEPNSRQIVAVAELCMDETVEVFLKERSAGSGVVIFRYNPGNSDPEIKWLSENNLEIHVPDTTYIDLQMIKYGDVEITYRIDHINVP